MAQKLSMLLDKQGIVWNTKRKLITLLEETNDNFRREFNFLKTSDDNKQTWETNKMVCMELPYGTAQRALEDSETRKVFRKFITNKQKRFHRKEWKMITEILRKDNENSQELSIEFLKKIISEKIWEIRIRKDLNIPDNKCIFDETQHINKITIKNNIAILST